MLPGGEQSYRRGTIAAGTDYLLVQRVIRAPSHCGFDGEPHERAFDDRRLDRARRANGRRGRNRALSVTGRPQVGTHPKDLSAGLSQATGAMLQSMRCKVSRPQIP